MEATRPFYEVEIEVVVRVRRNGQPCGKADKRKHVEVGYINPTERKHFGDEMETAATGVLERFAKNAILGGEE